MSVHGGDISWQTLRRIVHDWIGTAAELAEVQPLHGGSISTTLSLKTQECDRAVLKISQHRIDRSYVHEAYQLNVLRGLGLPTPEVYACKMGTLDEPVSYLLIEWREGFDLGRAKSQLQPEQFDHVQMHLAELLLTLHGQTHSHYTRLLDGEREEFESWPAFYRNCYDPVWREAEKMSTLPVKIRKQIARIHERLDTHLRDADCPRLIHGDVWASNVLVNHDAHGKWWVNGIIDPMCKYAHAESELAYLDLFHTSTPALLRAYQATHRLPPEYHSIRKPIYQLYELINHLQLFGNDYLKHLINIVEKLSRTI